MINIEFPTGGGGKTSLRTEFKRIVEHCSFLICGKNFAPHVMSKQCSAKQLQKQVLSERQDSCHSEQEILRFAQNDNRVRRISIHSDKQHSEFTCFGLSRLQLLSEWSSGRSFFGTFLSTQESTYKKKYAFTLAEVLITLGIIGVVAAMTMPTLMLKYQKHVTQNKLKKFYSIMTNAIKLSEVENGDYPSWQPTMEMDQSADAFEQWYNKYLDKYIVSIDKRKLSERDYQIGLKDGSGFVAYILSQGINVFYCTEYKYCGPEKMDGKKTFLFVLSSQPYNKGYFNAHQYYQPREWLLEKCKYGNSDDSTVSSPGRRHQCAGLIQKDGWEIKDDYPWEQIMIEPVDK